MKRHRQTLDDILKELSPVDTSWRDAHADSVIQRLQQIPQKAIYTRADLLEVLDSEHNGYRVDAGARSRDSAGAGI